jgi:hypothetical protein
MITNVVSRTFVGPALTPGDWSPSGGLSGQLEGLEHYRLEAAKMAFAG